MLLPKTVLRVQISLPRKLLQAVNGYVSGNMPNHGPITVYYHAEDGTAHAVTDYTPSYGDQALTLTWDSFAGCYHSEITHGPAIITVNTTPMADDGSGKTFSVVVSQSYDPDAPISDTASGTATIVNASLDVATMNCVNGEKRSRPGPHI